MDNKVSIDIECKSCEATGIYVGLAERKGAGVVCRECNGTGKSTFTGVKFSERKLRSDIKRVFPVTSIIVTPDISGGVSYEEFLDDEQSPYSHGNEIRQFDCPRSNDQFKVRGMALGSKCEQYLSAGEHISTCKLFHLKESCWQDYDAEIECSDS